MTDPALEHQADYQKWAAEKLGVPPDSEPAETARAFLKMLEQSDLACSREVFVAYACKAGLEQSIHQRDWAERIRGRDRERTLLTMIEDFARRYWALPPADRRLEFEKLNVVAASAPRALLRLEQLRDGLDVAGVREGDQGLMGLVKAVQEIYVARPGERALRRQALAASLRSQNDGAVQLRLMLRKHPEIASLETDLTPRVILDAAARDYTNLANSKLLSESLPEPKLGAEYRKPSLTEKLFWVLLALVGGLFGVVLEFKKEIAHPRPKFAPNDPVRSWNDFQLKLVTKPDGTRAVEAFDKAGKPVFVGEAFKRLMGSKEMLEKDAKDRKSSGESRLPPGIPEAILGAQILRTEDLEHIKELTKTKANDGSKLVPKNPER